MAIIDIPILDQDETAHGESDQGTPVYPQQGGGGEVGFRYHAFFGDGTIPHRRQIIEVKITGSNRVQLYLCSPQFLILYLQLNLMHLKFMEYLLHLLGRERVYLRRHRRCFHVGPLLGPQAQLARGAGPDIVLVHDQTSIMVQWSFSWGGVVPMERLALGACFNRQ